MHSHSNAPALALRAIGMHPKYAGYGYSLAILRITHRHPEYIYRLPKMVYPSVAARARWQTARVPCQI